MMHIQTRRVEGPATPEHKVTATKNSDGHLGPICNGCGGFGFTFGIAGTDHGCHRCDQTGVAQPTNAELMARIAQLEGAK